MKKVYLSIVMVWLLGQSCSETVIFDLEENLALEQRQIDDFLEQNNIQSETSERGLRFRILSPGTGPIAEEGQLVDINYEIYLLDSTFLDSNIPAVIEANPGFQPRWQSPFPFEKRERPLVFAEPYFLEFATSTLSQGGGIELFVPSALGFGDTQVRSHGLTSKVPSNRPILVRITVVEIRDN